MLHKTLTSSIVYNLIKIKLTFYRDFIFFTERKIKNVINISQLK